MATTKNGRSESSKQLVHVSLVSMPFKDLRHPPLQLGILESCLLRAGITVHSYSFDLAFIEYLHERFSDDFESTFVD